MISKEDIEEVFNKHNVSTGSSKRFKAPPIANQGSKEVEKLNKLLQEIFNLISLPHQLDRDKLIGSCNQCIDLIMKNTEIKGINIITKEKDRR